MGQPREVEQTVVTGPPAFAQPFIQETLQRGAEQLLRRPQQFFPGQTVAGFTPTELQAQQVAIGAAGAQAPLVGAAGEAQRFLLSPQQLLQATTARQAQLAAQPVVQAFQEQVLPSIRGQAIAAGGLGGTRQGVAEGLAAGRTAEALARQSAGIFGRGLETTLGALGTGLSLAPQTAALQALPAQTLAGVGGQQRAMEQALINAARERFQFQQQAPRAAIQEFAGLLGGLPLGQQQVATQEQFRNVGAGILGGGLLGAQLSSQLGLPGLAALPGAGLGALGLAAAPVLLGGIAGGF